LEPLPVKGFGGQVAEALGLPAWQQLASPVTKALGAPAPGEVRGLGGQVMQGLGSTVNQIAGAPKQAMQSLSGLFPHPFQEPLGTALMPPEVDPDVWRSSSDAQKNEILKSLNASIVNESAADYESRKQEYLARQPNRAALYGPMGALPVIVPTEGKGIIPFRGFRRQYEAPSATQEAVVKGLQPFSEFATAAVQPENVLLGGVATAGPKVAARLTAAALAPVLAESSYEDVQQKLQALQQNPNAANALAAATGIPLDMLLGGVGLHLGKESVFPKTVAPQIDPNLSDLLAEQTAERMAARKAPYVPPPTAETLNAPALVDPSGVPIGGAVMPQQPLALAQPVVPTKPPSVGLAAAQQPFTPPFLQSAETRINLRQQPQFTPLPGLPPEVVAPPQVAAAGPNINVPYRRPAAVPPATQALAEQRKAAGRRAIEEGLVGPAASYVSETLPYAKEGQFPSEGGPIGTLSELQRKRILAGQPDVRILQRVNPPLEPPGKMFTGVPIDPEALKKAAAAAALSSRGPAVPEVVTQTPAKSPAKSPTAAPTPSSESALSMAAQKNLSDPTLKKATGRGDDAWHELNAALQVISLNKAAGRITDQQWQTFLSKAESLVNQHKTQAESKQAFKDLHQEVMDVGRKQIKEPNEAVIQTTQQPRVKDVAGTGKGQEGQVLNAYGENQKEVPQYAEGSAGGPRQGDLSGNEGRVASATGLRPAVIDAQGNVHVGGITHDEVIKNNNIPNGDRVFVKPDGTVVSREQAARENPQIATTVEPGKMHSEDLINHVQGGGTQQMFAGLPVTKEQLGDAARKIAEFTAVPADVVKKLGFKEDAKIAPEQMSARLKNLLGEKSGTWEYLNQSGLKEFLSEPRSVNELKQWSQGVGSEAVKVHTYGMEGKVSEARKEYDKMTHEWYDNLGSDKSNIAPQYWSNLSKENQVKAEQYYKLKQQVNAEPQDTSPKATQYYKIVSALPPSEPMPDWTTTKSGKNVQRVDVVVPMRKASIDNSKSKTHPIYTPEDKVIWKQDNLHENLPNTLGWAMIQYKTGPKGERIAAIVESQSRWAQTLREERKGATTDAYQKAVDAKDHPLLRDYNRLILKSAIEQARKEGATHIMISDAETAMMTEGHDLRPKETRVFKDIEAAKQEVATRFPKIAENFDIVDGAPGVKHAIGFKEKNTGNTVGGVLFDKFSGAARLDFYKSSDNSKYLNVRESNDRIRLKENSLRAEAMYKREVTQEGGMRLNYDNVLPQIAEELTGSKGEKVSLGEHKNAVELDKNQNDYIESPRNRPRDNLIFRNADGTPKTDITGRLYEITPKQKYPFSLTGKDKGVMQLYAGIPLTPEELAKGARYAGSLAGARTAAEVRQAAQREMANATTPQQQAMVTQQVKQQLQNIKAPTPQQVQQAATTSAATTASVKAATVPLGVSRSKIVNSLRTSGPKADLYAAKDAADNKAVIVGQQAGKGVDALSKVLFGKESKAANEAATAFIEAGGDLAELERFRKIAAAKNDAKGLNAANFAIANYDKTRILAEDINKRHDDQFAKEQAAGLDVDYRENYIRHAYDLDKMPGAMADKFFGSRRGGGGSSFKKQRVFDTLYDAIDAGYGPAIRSWDAAALAENRVRAGEQMVNDRAWVEGMKDMKDPSTGMSIVTDMERRKNPQTGDVTIVPPKGYESWTAAPGQTFAVHKGYAGALRAAVSLSFIRDAELLGLPVGRILTQGSGFVKHAMLAFDSFHASRISAKATALKGSPTYNRGLALLEYSQQDLANALKAGDITLEAYNYAKENHAIAQSLLDASFNVGQVSEAIFSETYRKIPGLGQANKWIFDKLTRGAMMECGVLEFKRLKAAYPELADSVIARRVAKDLNTNFGNLGRQGIFKSKSAQDLTQLFFLAPRWFESMARTEAGSVKQLAMAPFQRTWGSLGKGTGTLLLATFTATQLVNMYFNGRPTWENEEGHKTDALIPGGKDGFYISPFSLPMEITHDIIRYTEDAKATDTVNEKLNVAFKILSNKFSPGFRAEEVLRTGEDYAGRKLTGPERLIEAGMSVLPVPLPAQPLIKSMLGVKSQPGQTQRQLLASAGIKAEPAKSGSQIIKNFANQYLYNIGKSTEKPRANPDNMALVGALQDKDMEAAKKAYDVLLQKHIAMHAAVGNANPEAAAKKDLQSYFESYGRQLITGSKEREAGFLASKEIKDSPHRQQLYKEWKKQNDEVAALFFSELQAEEKKSRKKSMFDFSSQFNFKNQFK
jgi:hypothetical protein